MDPVKTGALIRALRTHLGLTQQNLADRLAVSDRTISKWERGLGCPDISLLAPLAAALGVSTEVLLTADLAENPPQGGNMKHTVFYICPVCGNLVFSASPAGVQCCGRTLEPQRPQKAGETQRLHTDPVEDEWYITTNHPMTKAEHIAFAALLSGESLKVWRQYPEWDFQLRLPRRDHGLLVWYSTRDGLLYQLI